MSDDRLTRIETKLDRLSEIVTAHVAVEDAIYKRVPLLAALASVAALALTFWNTFRR